MALIGATNEAKIWNFLIGKGMNAFGAAGLMGNLYAESGLEPKNLQNSFEKKLGMTDSSYTKAVDDGSYGNFVRDSAGYGLAQWTFWSRKENLLQFSLSRKSSIGDLEMQLEFLYKELSESYKSVLDVLKCAASVKEASNAVLLQYERPADQGSTVQAKRASYGQKYYEKYADCKSENSGGSVMSVRIGHASISENGTTQGVAGDQTGKEVCVRDWYSKPWDYMAIHPDANVREKHAKAVEAACANDNIGYNWWGTNDRNSLYRLAKAVNYDLSKVGKCNCDCSSLQNVAAVASGSGATYGSNGWTTSTMKAALKALGYKIVTAKAYLQSADYCVRGAIYVKSSSHTVCGLDNGSKASQTLAAAGISGSASSSGNTGNTSYCGKGIGTAVAKATMNIRSGAGTGYKSLGTISKGTKVEVLEKLSSGWYKIVWPGASCGYAYTSNVNGAYYSYTANSSGSAASSSVKIDSAQSKDNSLAGKYKVTASALNLRAGAGTSKKILCAMKKGETVQCYGYYTSVNGTKWLYVVYNGMTGFCSIAYLKKQ